MRALVQRVARASVDVEGKTIASIDAGLLVFLGVGKGDGVEHAETLANKVAELRVFPDDEGKMNLSVIDKGGSVLVVSQFTLYGDTSKGRRPHFIQAAPPEEAIPLYDKFIQTLADRNLPVAQGRFGAMMDVHLTNAGPVTLMLDTD